MREEEIWRDIVGFEGYYQVSNLGRVKSVERTVKIGRGCYRAVHERILKTRKDRDGYLHVQLWKDDKGKEYLVHRLVANAFLENSQNLPEVNHIDQDKTNNIVNNLEYCSSSYNCNYGTRNKKIAEKLSKPVIGIDKITGLIVEFPSAHEASRQIGINQSSITKCCKGKKKSCGGHIWFYADDDNE